MGLVKFGVSNFLPPLYSLKKIAVLSFLISLVFVLMFVGFSQDIFGHRNGAYRYDDASNTNPDPFNPNWMRDLPDYAKITELSLPGTHDTWAGHQSYDNLRGSVRTQSMDLEEQLDAGIRVLDIRLKCIPKTNNDCDFPVHHGSVYLNKNWIDDTLEGSDDPNDDLAVLEWLKRHPSETVIMNLQEEDSDDDKFDKGMDGDVERNIGNGPGTTRPGRNFYGLPVSGGNPRR